MDSVFIYWDISNILHGAQRFAEAYDDTPDARQLVQINCDALLKLAYVNRPIEKAIAAGSARNQKKQRHLEHCLEAMGVQARIYDRRPLGGTEQQKPDDYLLECMEEDYNNYTDDPGIVVLLTGDGAGHREEMGFYAILGMMHEQGWRIELLSWTHSCHQGMRQWVDDNGYFIPLDKYYEAITFIEPSRLGQKIAPGRESAPLKLLFRPRF